MRLTRRVSALCALVCLAATAAVAAEAGPVGKKIDDFTLKSQFGKEYSLHDMAKQDAVVVVFLGAECPLAKLYGPRLVELAAKFDAAKVAFVGIDSNQQDSIQEIAAYATRHKIAFPILKDPGNRVADKFGAARTPEVFVLDRDRVVRYHGRVDDQYGFTDGVGYQRPSATRNDLVEALNEMLASKPVSVPSTSFVGCLIGRVRPMKSDSQVTYSKHIAPVFQDHCLECHRPGRIGPFSMTSYDELVGWGEMIKEVVTEGRMPPWHANPEFGHFSNDIRLTADEKKLIATWVDNGCPEGNPADLPKPKQFVDGWAIGEPDEVVYMADDPIDVPAEGVIDYYHLVVDPGWKEDRWIKAAEAKPSSLETVHHILVFVAPPDAGGGGRGALGRGGDGPRRNPNGAGQGNDAPRRQGAGGGRGGRGGGGGIGSGNLVAGYAPGATPMINSDGSTAMHVKAGSKLVFQLHYTPNGTPAKDRSFVGFKFAKPEEVKYVARSTSVGNTFFAIPPGADDYEATASGTFDNDVTLLNLTPHMHMRGKSFRYEVTYPDGTKEVLLDVPAYDFNWQTTYDLKEPKRIPKGTKLLCTAHWDNSSDNLSNPDPTITVRWGDQSFEEMMLGFYVEVYPKDQVPARPSGGFGQIDPEQVFKSLDANKDGQLSKEELPERMADRLILADTNRDGGISQEELTKLFKLLQASGVGRGQSGGN